MSETTVSAQLPGRLIVGCNDPGTCEMHKCELITKHVMGQVTRKCNKQVVNSFPEMEIFRKKMRKFVTWIMDTKQELKYKQHYSCRDIDKRKTTTQTGDSKRY